MKLNKLTSAVSISLAALVLTACGNDNNTPNTSSQNIVNESVDKASLDKTLESIQAQIKGIQTKLDQGRKEVDKAEADKADKAEAEQAQENIPAKNNPVAEIAAVNSTIKSFDVTKKPSVGGLNYIRSEGSSFDTANNPVQSGSNIVAYSDTLQDKTLSNFVAASQTFTGADGKKRIYKNVLGATESQPNLKNNLIYGDYGAGSAGTTIQDVNGDVTDANGDVITNGNVTIAQDYLVGGSVDTLYTRLKEVIKEVDKRTGLIPDDDFRVYFNDDHKEFIANLVDDQENQKDELIKEAEWVYIQPLEDQVLYLAGVDARLYTAADDSKPLVDYLSFATGNSDLSNSGLIITQVREGEEANYAKPEGLVVTKQDHKEAKDGLINNQSTRVFGRAFDSNDLLKDKDNVRRPNAYQASFDPTDDSLVALTPIKLNNVQYGRLTSTLDAIKQPKDSASINKQYVARDFSTRDVNNSVDHYFYRGVDATSIADMAKVKATGVDINYQGHALVYGRDTVSGASNAVGGAPTFGNFVQATYKTATGDVNGSIYNFSVPTDAETKADITKNDLITFKGTVKGNTVEGSATRLADSNPGSFIGSFYGKNANELGGAINSVDQNTAYGNTKWGAVFGAKTDIVAENDQTAE